MVGKSSKSQSPQLEIQQAIWSYILPSSCFKLMLFSYLQQFDLVLHNQLNGSLPFSLFRRLRQMMSVDETILGYFGDEYPIYEVNDYHDSMAMVFNGNIMQLLRILRVMAIIDLSCNHFEGEIPSSIGGLISIQQLNLSHNNFTGQIPPQIGNLFNLHSLDLSCNQLGGNIPDKFCILGFSPGDESLYTIFDQYHLEHNYNHFPMLHTWGMMGYVVSLCQKAVEIMNLTTWSSEQKMIKNFDGFNLAIGEVSGYHMESHWFGDW
ncbi:hypothetical protein Leryth_022526 [Lithospermum erythrorhizon]|nr:hypothetical protein Leryth_022526 [Lithospermum erythrorhizon]